ncbi:MAG: GAP family protein [Nocardioidaceae bacterium]
MNAEALLLALSSVIRPTTLGAVYAMLSRPAAHRLLRAYLAAGLACSLVVGIGVVVVLHGYVTPAVSTFWRAIFDVALGAAACGYAIGVGTHRRSAPSRAPSRTTRWLQHRLDNLTASRAALIGLVTHLPGLVYLAALNAIAGSAAKPLNAAVQVVVYNTIWYSVAIAAFVVSMLYPAASKDLLEKADALVGRLGRPIVVTVFGLIGVYLLGKGLSILRDWWSLQ